MSQSLIIGLGLTLLAGIMSGNCLLPMKFNRRWQWENSWLVFSIVSLVVLPWLLAACLVSHLFDTYASLSFAQIVVPVAFGAGWGIAQVLFGISVQRLGLGLAYAIIIGLGALLGTLVPLFVQHRSQVGRDALADILGGVAFMVVGIGLSAWAGNRRERVRDPSSQPALQLNPRSSYFAAVLLAVLCGVMAPMLNYSFAFGQEIARQAVHLGNSEVRAAYAVWPIGLAGGFLPNISYSLYLLKKRRSWPLFKPASPDVYWSTLMGGLWMGAFALYGMSASYLGTLGTSIGWGLMQIFMIMTATLSGILTGEWKGAPRFAKLLLGCGLACLVTATALLAMGNQ